MQLCRTRISRNDKHLEWPIEPAHIVDSLVVKAPLSFRSPLFLITMFPHRRTSLMRHRAIRTRLILLDMIRNSHHSLLLSLHQPCETISWHRRHSGITFDIQDLCGDSLHYISEPPLLNKSPLLTIFQLTTSPSVFRLTIALPYRLDCTPCAWGTAFMNLFVYINDAM